MHVPSHRAGAALLASIALCGCTSVNAQEWPGTAGTFDIKLRTLLLTNDGDNDYIVPQNVLSGYATNFVKRAQLPDLSQPSYSSIVVSRDWLSTDEFDNMRAYCKKYGARIAYLNAEPWWSPAVEDEADASKYIVFDAGSKATETANVLNTATGWLSEGLELRPVTLGVLATPVMRTSATPQRSSDGGVVVFTTNTDGCEEMYFMMQATRTELVQGLLKRYDPSTQQKFRHLTSLTLALGSMWLPWVTRGVYVGKRRILFTNQIDDVFAITDLYKARNDDEKKFRIDGADCESHLEQQDRINAMLPPGSDYKLELAFNGFGYEDAGYERQGLGVGLNQCLRDNKKKFNWVSHTWTHQHLDWLNAPDCDGKTSTCPTPKERIYTELQYNIDLMEGKPVTPNRQLYKHAHKTEANAFVWEETDDNWSPHSLVPPEISGLVPLNFVRSPWTNYTAANRTYGRPGNFAAFQTFKEVGITTVTGDNTRIELLQENMHHGLWSNEKTQGAEGVLIIPRHAPSTPYHAHTPERYLENWVDREACKFTIGESCSRFNYTFDEAIERDGRGFVPYIMMFRYDPFMFHQANMHAFDYKGEKWSLVNLWSHIALKEVTTFINKLPVLTPPMDKIGQMFREREWRDACGVSAVLKVAANTPVSVDVSGSASCTAVVTLDKDAVAELKASSPLNTETYGPDTTVFVPLDSNTVSVALQPSPATGGSGTTIDNAQARDNPDRIPGRRAMF